jgi:hypothetical protein
VNHKGALSAGTHLFTVLGVNAVPALGVFAGGWPAETAMLVYLLETLTMVVLSALRVRLLAPAREETMGDQPAPASPLPAGLTVTTPAGSKSWMDNQPRDRRQILEGFLVVSFGFSGVSGVFIVVFLFLIRKAPIAASDVTAGLVTILIFQLFELVADLILWRRMSLGQADILLLQSLRRAFVLYFGVFIGLCGAAYTGSWFVIPFIVLKTLMDVGTQVEYFLKRRPVTTGIGGQTTSG